jgi:8-amino-7-oxononanoate synthase
VTAPARLASYQLALDELNQKGRLRSLKSRAGVDFASNDYLGLASSSRLRDAVTAAIDRGVAVGAGGSRLLRGNSPEHEALEASAAEFFRAERSLYFSSGYLANYSVFSTLPQREDLVVLDTLVHASAHEGTRAGRALVTRARHNDAQSFEEQIRMWRSRGGRGRAWIAVESLYGMDADRAPLHDLKTICHRHGAMLVIDEAHATGVFGTDGRGLAAEYEGQENVLVLHTCSKALGGAGALVNGAGVLCDFLVNRCRPFIFATAPSPLLAVAALEALKVLKEEPERQRRLLNLVAFADEEARVRGISVPTGSQILPVIVGDDASAVELASALQMRGFDVRAIRPPSVPEGTARLRISLTLNVDETAIEGLFEALAREWMDVTT